MADRLLQTAQEEGLEISDGRFAQLLDDKDPLKFLRDEFHVPSVSEILDHKLNEGACLIDKFIKLFTVGIANLNTIYKQIHY